MDFRENLQRQRDDTEAEYHALFKKRQEIIWAQERAADYVYALNGVLYAEGLPPIILDIEIVGAGAVRLSPG